MDSTTPQPHCNCHPPLHRHFLTPAIIVVSLAIHCEESAAASITFSAGQPGLTHQLSNGDAAPNDGSITFEIGVFYGVDSAGNDFVPTADNTGEWANHWRILSGSGPDSNPLAGSSVGLSTVSSIFGIFDGFASSVDLDHNDAPFAAGTPGYLWGFDQRSGQGTGEWILVSNPIEWKLPDGLNPIGLSQTWTVASAEGMETLVGSVNGGAISFGSVNLGPPAVPEPGVFVLLLSSVGLLGQRRRPAGVAAATQSDL